MSSKTQGYVFAILAITIFSLQDAISKHLAQDYPPVFIAMIRYWAYGLFVSAVVVRKRLGWSALTQSKRPILQIIRSALLALQVILAITCFSLIGLAHAQAIFAGTPLVVALLSILFLKEKVDLSRWLAIIAGLVGVMVILRPQGDFLDFKMLLAVAGTVMFAVYAILTRFVSRHDTSETTFIFTGFIGAITLTMIGPFFWTDIHGTGYFWLAVVCCTSISSHYFLIRAYSLLDASAVQPLSYMGLVYASLIGTALFNEKLDWPILLGASIVVGAGLLYLMREHAASKRRVIESA